MDEEVIDSVIARHFAGANVLSIGRLTGGVSAEAYRIELQPISGNPRQVVVRILGDAHCGHPASLEFSLLEALHEAGRAVPEPLAFGGGDGEGAPSYVVLDYVEGETMIPPALV